MKDHRADVDWAIWWIGGGVFVQAVKEEGAAGAGACLGLEEVGGIAVDMQDHIACTEPDDGVRMGCCIIEKVDGCFHGRSCSLALCLG